MTSLRMPKLSGALLALTALMLASPAGALPAGGLARTPEMAGTSSDLLDRVQYRGNYDGRRRGYGGNRYRGNTGRNLAIGLGGLIIGGIVLSETARSDHRREHRGDWQRCSDTYRSFESDTGMYTRHDGERRTCPYLR